MRKWLRSRPKWITRSLIVFCAFFAVERICHQLTDGFSVNRVHLNFAPQKEFYPEPPSAEIVDALKQPYAYLGSGSQSFAFKSDDGRYVLKFFKLGTSIWKRFNLPRFERRKHSFVRAFESCLIYQNRLKQESGLLYCHLNPSDYDLPTTTLVDRNRCLLPLQLSQVPFVLQKHIEPTSARLTRLKGLADAKVTIDQLFDFLITRYEMGLSDKDPNLAENFGFIDDQVVSLDVGGLIPDRENLKEYFFTHELLKAKWKLNRWLKVNDPDLIPYVDEKVADIISKNL